MDGAQEPQGFAIFAGDCNISCSAWAYWNFEFQKSFAISPAFSGSIGFAKTVIDSKSDNNKSVVNLFIFMSFSKI